MDISDVVKSSGLPASTLRSYEEKGLIHSVGRKGLKRVFDPSVMDQLALIALGKSAGFSLAEIASAFTANGPQIKRAHLLSKAEEIDKTIKQLKAMRDGLRHAADCPSPSHFECPKFQRLLAVALKRQNRTKLG